MTRDERAEHLLALMSEISAIMKEQNISQAELARRTGMDRGAVNKVLSLETDPRASTLVAILKALDRHLHLAPSNSRIA